MKRSVDRQIFNVIAYPFIGICALLCLIPFIMVVASSFTSEADIMKHGYSIFPVHFSLEGYKIAFRSPAMILRSYGVTIFVTAVGTVTGVFLMAMTAYVIHKRNFRLANPLAFFFFFTTLFNAGLVPYYILMIKYLGMRNNVLALILPSLFNVFYVIVMKAFMRGVPDALSESAHIDGADEFTIFTRIMLPVSKPVIATITLFIALGYWNDWYNNLLFISDTKLQTLQYFLYTLISNADAIRTLVASQSTSSVHIAAVPIESLKMAMTVIATGPILLLYPFIQRYFVKGLTLGAVKG